MNVSLSYLFYFLIYFFSRFILAGILEHAFFNPVSYTHLIISKQDKSGIDIYIKPGTTNESVHIPVILSQSGLQELVYNDFHRCV